MIDAALALVLAVLAVLTVYPYLIYPQLLRLLSPMPLAPPDAARHSYALFFCAHNEEKVLPETIANLRRVKAVWPELSIYAYSDASTDETFTLLEAACDVLTAVEGRDRAGKPNGMRRIVQMSDADILIFMDANVLIDPATVRNFEDYFSRPDVGTVACTLSYIDEEASATAKVSGLYWRLEESLKQRESATGSTMGADGSLFAVRRPLYPPVAPDLQDDFLASMQAIFAGLRCVSAPDIRASERSATCSAAEFRRKRRIACGAFSTHRAMRAQLAAMSPRDRFKYVSHKLLRWFGGFYIAAGAAVAALLAGRHGLLEPFLLASGGAAVLFAALYATGARPVRTVGEILSAIAATAVGVMESIRGTQYVTWTPTER